MAIELRTGLAGRRLRCYHDLDRFLLRDHYTAMPSPTHRCQGFTLIELLVVIGVGLVLLAAGIPAYQAHQRQGKLSQTRSLVTAVAGAMAAYGRDDWPVWDAAVQRQRVYPLWDWNRDGLLDGIPEREVPGITTAGHADHALYRSGYRGVVAMTGLAVASGRVDTEGRPLDAWRQPLRIARAVGVYGQGTVGVWSIGPDGADGPLGSPAAVDNITSWQERR